MHRDTACSGDGRYDRTGASVGVRTQSVVAAAAICSVAGRIDLDGHMHGQPRSFENLGPSRCIEACLFLRRWLRNLFLGTVERAN